MKDYPKIVSKYKWWKNPVKWWRDRKKILLMNLLLTKEWELRSEEFYKMHNDVFLQGFGFMKDGKHIPIEDFNPYQGTNIKVGVGKPLSEYKEIIKDDRYIKMWKNLTKDF